MKFKADTSTPKPMEVWNAKLDFDGSTGAKNRPIIVLDRKGESFVVFMVTSHGHHPETDIKLMDPYEVMLDKTSTVRTDRTFSIPRSRFNYKLGDLSPDDCEMVQMFYGRVKGGKRIKTDYVRSRIQSDDLSHVNKVVRHPFGIRCHRKEL
ncbi:MAG: type II toxin-antitoxin system PemK/MazF family toxin [Candidatus Methanomethylophilaceae archaeon]|nr:type II toxin-antitoxin system PemK/MazF family toxin [Candidatus Methanomethylophilaceae archaeon]